MFESSKKLLAMFSLLPLAWSWATPAASAVDFERQVAPLLSQRCLSCHNASEAKGELNLTTRKSALTGGQSGAAFVPGDPAESYLLQRVRDGKMPPKKKGKPLSSAEIETLTDWIKTGAHWPEGRVLSELDATTDKRAGKDWWSLRPVKRPVVPETKEDWVRNPIDAFILDRLRARKLSPSAPASKAVLLRRIYFDLTGLPPTPEAIQAFTADKSPNAYEKLVDALLASLRDAWGCRAKSACWRRFWHRMMLRTSRAPTFRLTTA